MEPTKQPRASEPNAVELPVALRKALLRLDAAIGEIVRQGHDASDATARLGAIPELPLLAQALAGQQLSLSQALISFGAGSQQGDITIGDVAGGSILKLTVNFSLVQPPVAAGPPPLPPVVSLPTHPAMLGRSAEQAECLARLAAQNVLLITGMAGVGKSILGGAIARQLGEPELIVRHSLVSEPGLLNILRRIAALLTRHGHEDLWRVVHENELLGKPADLLYYLLPRLTATEAVLWLEDVHLIGDEPLFIELVQRLRSGRARLIGTSRQAIDGLRGKEVFELSGLDVAETRLFLQARGLALAPPLVEQLHKATEGNVLFLDLAADLLANDPSAAIIANLARVPAVAGYLLDNVHQTLTASGKLAMTAIAILRGQPASLDCVEYLVEAELASTDSIASTLIDLHARHLLFAQGVATGLYSQHSLIREHFYRQAGRRQRLELHRRAAAYFSEIEPEPLRTAQHWLWANEYTRAAEAIIPAIPLLIGRGDAQELRQLLADVQLAQLPAELRVDLAVARAEVAAVLSDYQTAKQSYTYALDALAVLPITFESGQRKATIYRGLGKLAEDHESPEAALEWIDQGLAAIAGSSTFEEALLLHRRGSALISMGEYDAAREASERALGLLMPGAENQRADLLVNLGVIACAQGEIEQGIAHYRRALVIYEASGNAWRKISVWQNLGIEREIAGDWGGAVADYRQALELAERLGNISRLVNLKLLLGILHTNQGAEQDARHQLEECLSLASAYQLHEWVSGCQSALADLHLRQNDITLAQPLLAAAHKQAVAHQLRYQLPEILRGQALVQLHQGSPAAALELAAQSYAVACELTDPLEEGKSLRVLGQVYLGAGQVEEAREHFAASLEQLDGREPYEAARTKLAWATLQASAEPASAISTADGARATFAQFGAQRELRLAEALLGDLRTWVEHP